MKKTIRIIGTIATVGVIALGAYLLGTTQAETITEVKTVTEIKEVVPDEFINNYVDMRKVTYFEVEDGLQLYYEDGSGYFWE